MPRPGQLTRSRANRTVKTPGGRTTVHRRKIYTTQGTCAISGAKLQLPRSANQELRMTSSHSARRPNRPYGGYASSKATRRSIIRATRKLHK